MKSWAIIIAAFILSGAIVFYALSNRYYIDTSTSLKVDRLTGETYPLNTKTENNTSSTYTSTVTNYSPSTSTNSDESVATSLRVLTGRITPTPRPKRISNEEYVDNLLLILDEDAVFDKFKQYYKNVIEPLKTDPLFYQGDPLLVPEYTTYRDVYSKYSPLLSQSNIAKAYSENEISDAKEYLEYVINTYKTEAKVTEQP